MTTALTGSMGWTGLHPLQLGGPPLISTWGRPLPNRALPLIAHVYENDGVTGKGTMSVLNRPNIKATTANGGFEQITLEVSQQSLAAIYGQVIYGQPLYGGRTLQGNVVRLSENGGPWNGFVYGGVVESLPDVRSATGTKHEIVVSPFGWELTRVACQLVYTSPIDVIQTVRDALVLTQHCHCDQVSVPVSTGVMIATSGAVDYRGQKVNQVLDTARSILGPTWYWHCDEMGRVWFQPQGSSAIYTLTGGQHYEERATNGGDIQDRINQIHAVGGVPTGGSANVQAVVNGASQSAIGVRTLDPPIQVPGITDQPTLSLIASGVLGTLDQTWTRVQLKALPSFAQRVHGSQPGGPMLRYLEPIKNALPESGQGQGYVGPFIVQSVDYDGAYQQIEAGSIPVTNQTDVDNMVKRWAQRSAAIALINTGAFLNLNQTLTGSLQSGTGTIAANGQRATLWSLGQQEFQAIDPNAVTRAEMGDLPANGISPAQWGFRANDASGNPIFDSLGLIAVMQVLGREQFGPGQTIGGGGSATDVTITNSSLSFTLARQVHLFALAMVNAEISNGTTGTSAFITFDVDGTADGTNGTTMQWLGKTGTNPQALAVTGFYFNSLAAGSHTISLAGNVTPTTDSFFVNQFDLVIFQLGS